ncbi:MaoC family dehydratase [Rhodococcus globerulus]|uniref:MaoC family dehydratase n=1 Tax=Rhodococcus globerulus TaxID=33008 RepID=UPI000A83D65D|nr:MaoC family dehydratase [Rhodococcus globerulus]
MKAVDLRARAHKRERVRYFDEFSVGQRFEHHWGRTLTETDNMLLSTLTLSYNPLYFNREHARDAGFAEIVVNPMLMLMITIGLSVEDLSESGGAFLGLDNLSFHRPVVIGETLTASSTVLAARRSDSRPDMGIVTWSTEACIANDPVLAFTRSNLVRTKGTR